MNYFVVNFGSNHGLANLKLNKYIDKLKKKEECCIVDIKELVGKEENFISNALESDKVYICGGDGTISTFLNTIKNVTVKCRLYVYEKGSGNDLAKEFKGKVFEITDIIKNLPHITANNEEFVCVNGCGMGVDAAVCVRKEKYDQTGIKKSYTKICLEAFKSYKPYSLDITIDGKDYHYDNVWFFVANHGKYFGGGKKVAPKASRYDDKVDVCIAHGYRYPKVLLIFPFLIFGLHLMFKKHISYFQCKNVKALVNDDISLQIDGEVKEGIKTLEVKA